MGARPIIKLFFLFSLLCINACSFYGRTQDSDSTITNLAEEKRREAYELSKKGWNGLAIAKVKDAITIARGARQISPALIEAYDDAGLYYYNISDYKNSTKYQAVAVLLAMHLDPENNMLEVYRKRLGWALDKYDKILSITGAANNPIVLFCDSRLMLSLNPDLQAIYKNLDVSC